MRSPTALTTIIKVLLHHFVQPCFLGCCNSSKSFAPVKLNQHIVLYNIWGLLSYGQCLVVALSLQLKHILCLFISISIEGSWQGQGMT